jgi:hypothetical protein
MNGSNSAEQQIHYAFCLREAQKGWTPETRKAYFQWFYDIGTARGGASFGGFLENIRKVAIGNLEDEDKAALGELTGPLPAPKDPLADLAPRAQVKQWSVDELAEKFAAKKAHAETITSSALTERMRNACAINEAHAISLIYRKSPQKFCDEALRNIGVEWKKWKCDRAHIQRMRSQTDPTCVEAVRRLVGHMKSRSREDASDGHGHEVGKDACANPRVSRSCRDTRPHVCIKWCERKTVPAGGHSIPKSCRSEVAERAE